MFGWKCLFTFRLSTREWFLSGMCSFMRFQMMTSCEGFSTPFFDAPKNIKNIQWISNANCISSSSFNGFYLYGLSWVWVRTCFLRSLKVVKYLPQPVWIQLKVFPLWSLWWALNLYCQQKIRIYIQNKAYFRLEMGENLYLYNVLNAFSQPLWVHSKGFTLVWTRMCIFKLYDVKKAFPHWGSEHLKRYSPTWKN